MHGKKYILEKTLQSIFRHRTSIFSATQRLGVIIAVILLGSKEIYFPATMDTYTHITDDMQRGAAEKIGGFMESVTAANTPEPPDPPEGSRCKVIPFEKVG